MITMGKENMQLILFALVTSLTTNLHPSAPSAADAKSTAAAERYPEIPKEVVDALYPAYAPNIHMTPEQRVKIVEQWVQKNPEVNKNGRHTFDNGESQVELLTRLISFSNNDSENGQQFILYLPRFLLLEPNVRYTAKLWPHREPLEAIILPDVDNFNQEDRNGRIPSVKQIINLLRKQGESDLAIRSKLESFAARNPKQNKSENMKKYASEIIAAAQEYLHDLQVAELAEEELKKHLLPELAPIGAEYVAPLKKKDAMKASPARKSPAPAGSGKPAPE